MLSRNGLSIRYRIILSKTAGKINVNFEQDIKMAREKNDCEKGAEGRKVQVAKHTALSLGINNVDPAFIDFMTAFYSVYTYLVRAGTLEYIMSKITSSHFSSTL